ncbi:MAG TPA: hypothetical protein VFL80_00200 [Thermoanaerobaculia bacterium]|nr:hypothetical protein [Thermoanaerobaculia bacterium]
MAPASMAHRRDVERRREKRITLAEPIVARFGSSVVVVVDISPLGARIEHYSRVDRGTERPLRIQWGSDMGIRARVVSTRVERLLPGDAGLTVYRTGLSFDESQSEQIGSLREMISNAVAATLVEQVANARGFWTEHKEEMPIFREGILTTSDPHLEEKLKKLLPRSERVRERGFVRMTLLGDRWKRTWTLDPQQPQEGFTISAAESAMEIDMLCDAYATSSQEGRELIRKLAATSLESHGSSPQPEASAEGATPEPGT